MKSRLVGFLKQAKNRVSDWSLRQSHRVLISSPMSPSQKDCETNPSREEKKASVFSNRMSWRKSQSLHSQKLPRWAQQMYVTKGKNPYS